MKLTQAQLQTLMSSIGLEAVELVDDDAQSDFDQDKALQAIDNTRMAIIKPRVERDNYDRMRTDVSAIVAKEATKIIKQITGVDAEKIKGVEKWEDVLQIGLEHMKGLSGADKAELQNEIERMVQNHQKALQERDARLQDTEKQWREKWSAREIKNYLNENVVQKSPLSQGADRFVLTDDLYNYIQSNYHVSYDEGKKEVKLFRKDKPEVPAMNETETEFVKLNDIAKNFFTPRGLWQTDMRNQRPDPTAGEDYKPAESTRTFNRTDNVDPLEAFNKQREEFFTKQ